MAKSCSCVVPLWLIFFLQALLVCGAFAAVIVLMAVKFNEQYTTAITDKLSLSQLGAANKIDYRYRAYEEFFVMAAKQYIDNPDKLPLIKDGSTFDELIPYFSNFYIFPAKDQDIQYCYQSVYSNISLPGTDRKRWTIAVVNKFGYSIGYNGTQESAVNETSSQPWSKVTVTKKRPFEIGNVVGYEVVGTILQPFWSSFKPFKDPTSGRQFAVSAFYYPFDVKPTNSKSFAHRHFVFVVTATVLQPAILEAMASDDNQTIAVIFGLRARTLVTGRVPFPLYNYSAGSPWSIDEIPDDQCRRMFHYSEEACNSTKDKCLTPIVITKEEHLVAIARAKTLYAESLLLVQYTPREFFYADGDRIQRNGILIGVFAALAVILSCVLIWLAIKRPLTALQDNMDLAAEMRNDEVVETSPALSEISTLTCRFTAMNNKLLAARPFLPQSLLEGGDDGDGEGEEEETNLQLNPSGGSIFIHNNSNNNNSNINNSNITKRQSGVNVNGGSMSVKSNSNNFKPQQSGWMDSSMMASSDAATRRSKGRVIVTQKQLTHKRVGVLCVNVRDFLGSTRDSGLVPEKIAMTHTKLLSQVQTAAQSNKGIVDYFHGDRFVCTFNAAKHCASPARSAASAANSIRLVFEEQMQRTFPAGVAMGMASGRALVGNMGTDTMKRFSTVGAVYTEAVALQDTMRLREENCALFIGNAVGEVELAVLYEVLGVIPATRLARGAQRSALVEYTTIYNNPFSAATHNASHRPTGTAATLASQGEKASSAYWDHSTHVVAALVRRCTAATEDEEWMYQLQNMNSDNPYRAGNHILLEFLLTGNTNSSSKSDGGEMSEESRQTVAVLKDRLARGAASEYIL